MNSVEINLSPPSAAFTATPTSGYAPLSVQFTDQSTNGPTSWDWDFGDGGTSTDQNPVHVFTDFSGSPYTVTLTAGNSFGSHQANMQIVVNELTQPVIHIESMTVTRVNQNGGRQAGECAVFIADNSGQPVSGAAVNATYDGPTAGSVSGTTNSSGVATLQSRSTKNASGTWCFTVTDVTKSGTLYDPTANIITTACESGAKSLSASADNTPVKLVVDQVYPNPFTNQAYIRFTLPEEAKAKIEIYSVTGQLMDRLDVEVLPAGQHTCRWNASDVSPGVYYLRISAGQFVESKAIIRK